MLRIAAFSLILLTFFGSAGVLIYSHTCLHEQITINTLFTSSDHCEADHRAQLAENCCDASAAADQEVRNDHCCSESVSAFYLSFRFFEELPAFQFILPVPAIEVKDRGDFVPQLRRELLSLGADPDPPSGRDILTRICIWRL